MTKRNWLMMTALVGVWTFALACNDPPPDQDTETVEDTNEDTESGTEEDAGDSEDAGPEEADTITVTLNVPEDFDGVPEILAAMFFDSPNPSGMPSAFGQTISGPELAAGEPYEFEVPQTDLSGNVLEGTYYLAITLYCEGGGGGQFPVAGTDWVAANGEGLVLGTGTGAVDAGEMTLIPYEK